jgi:phospholipid/cholesterol/gamma-HCH transport system substrate-binding protein
MASPKTKLAVGLFVACGLACAVLAVIWLGMSRFLEKGQFYVTYFDESIQGLVVDSPVKYRGVFIGRVESISVAPDSELIKVILKIESGQTLDSNIVAQLKSVGITGSMFVELDRL